jgi:hypothetical protein
LDPEAIRSPQMANKKLREIMARERGNSREKKKTNE